MPRHVREQGLEAPLLLAVAVIVAVLATTTATTATTTVLVTITVAVVVTEAPDRDRCGLDSRAAVVLSLLRQVQGRLRSRCPGA